MKTVIWGMRLMREKELLIIIPAYNEEKNIAPLLEQPGEPEISSYADVLVVDDASTDSTRDIVQRYGFPVVSHVYNLGYGSGLQSGYKYAVLKGYSYVIQMDADGQHDACNVSVLYRALTSQDGEGNKPDIVIGSRFMEGSSPYKVSAVKRFAIGLFKWMIRMGTGKRYTDPTSGLQGLSRRAVKYYSHYGNFDDRYPDANMIMQMTLLGYRLQEVPAVMHYRTVGVSMHSGLKPIIYMFRMFFSILAILIRIRILKTDVERKG